MITLKNQVPTRFSAIYQNSPQNVPALPQTSALPQISRDTASFKKTSQKQGQGIKFGLEPMTWIGLTTTAHFYKKAIDWTLSNLNSNPMQRLKESTKFKNGQTFLELANACEGNDRLEYIRKAESAFIKSSDDYSKNIHKAEAYKYAAICAKILNRDKNTTDTLAEKAGDLFMQAHYDFRDDGLFDFIGIRHDINNSDIPEVINKLHSYKRVERIQSGKLTTIGDDVKENCIVQ